MADSISREANRSPQWQTVSVLGAATWLITSPWTELNGKEVLTEADITDESDVSLTQPLIAEVSTDQKGEGEGGEGEGEGGEGEGASASEVDFKTNDVAYLTQLGLIRGHLAVGYALYRQNLPDLAETHMKHPREEIYSSVVPAFESRGCDGFGTELTELTRVVTDRAPTDEVDETYRSLVEAIDACEQRADTSNPIVISKVIESLLRTAGVEYQIGVIDGTISNLHEYQDAWGFTQIAEHWARSNVFTNTPTATAVAAQLQDVIAGLDTLWPSLDPDDVSGRDAAQLFGAASQVEVTALPLQR